MLDIIRDAPLGQALRFISRNKLLRYPEELPGFELPIQYRLLLKIEGDSKQQNPQPSTVASNVLETLEFDTPHSSRILTDETMDLEVLEQVVTTITRVHTAPYSNERMRAEQALSHTKSLPIVPQQISNGIILVDWYTTDDSENPQNWSKIKKGFITFILCFYTFTVYCAGPIYAPSEVGIVEQFGVSPVVASLGLSLYVLAYGIGDLLFSPLTEIPAIGREIQSTVNLTFIVFWILTFPTATVNNFGGFLVLRLFLGFFGSPALANGGATIGDMFSLIYIPYGLSFWVLSAWCGPAFGPLIGGFAAMVKGWRWPMWEVVWMSSLVLLVLLIFLPETSGAKILLQRARRLRKLTGQNSLQSQCEIDQQNLTAKEILFSALVRPIEIMLKDPSILFVNLYTGYFYGVFYTFFEVFPLVFPPFYDFNLGETGTAFLSCFIGVVIALLSYFAYLYFYMVPDNLKNGFREQEHRLVPAVVGSFLLPVGLFMFAWTADKDIQWSVPLVGVGIFVIGHFWTLQSLFIYIPFSYPKYAASLFAGNSIWRSGIGGASVVFARPLFINLGVHKGVTLLAGLSVAGIFGTTGIYVFGKRLRARSKFAEK